MPTKTIIKKRNTTKLLHHVFEMQCSVYKLQNFFFVNLNWSNRLHTTTFVFSGHLECCSGNWCAWPHNPTQKSIRTIWAFTCRRVTDSRSQSTARMTCEYFRSKKDRLALTCRQTTLSRSPPTQPQPLPRPLKRVSQRGRARIIFFLFHSTRFQRKFLMSYSTRHNTNIVKKPA